MAGFDLRLGLLVVLLACGGDEPAAEPAVRDPYIAMQADFADLFEWPRWPVPDIGSTHGHQRGTPSFIYVKGAPERVLEMCAKQRGFDGDVPLYTDYWHAQASKIAANVG